LQSAWKDKKAACDHPTNNRSNNHNHWEFLLKIQTLIAAAMCYVATGALADPSSARYVCKDFIERSGYNVQDWGQWPNWTAVDNRDGSWSVGAKFMGAAPGGAIRNLYVTCVMRKNGDNWRLEKLARMF
jgi:hypothetical protein